MKLTRLRRDSPTKNTCPALHVTDAASPTLGGHLPAGEASLVVQGKRVTDPEALAELELPPDETAVEVPITLLLDLGSEEVRAHDECP